MPYNPKGNNGERRASVCDVIKTLSVDLSHARSCADPEGDGQGIWTPPAPVNHNI